MQIRPLWSPPQPDLSMEVIHLTGRYGPQHAALPPEIANRTAEGRLVGILEQRRIRAFPSFSIGIDDPVVCFSEATLTGIYYLLHGSGGAPRYEPYGIAFTKQAVFEHGAGPAFYVRGDEWHLVSQLPAPLRGRANRFWPGAVPDPGERPLQQALLTTSLWTHEREWRIVDPQGFSFTWDQVAYVLVPDHASWQRISTALLNPLEAQAQLLAAAFEDQDPNVLSAEADVRDCAAALAVIPVKFPSKRLSPEGSRS